MPKVDAQAGVLPRSAELMVSAIQKAADEGCPAGAQPLSNLSHELRTCLAIITLLSGNLDLLYERLEDAERQKMIRDIRKHTQKLNDMIDGVLSFADGLNA